MNGEKRNRFEKSPWLAALVIIFASGTLLLYGAEKIAAVKFSTRNVVGPWGKDRHIRLRECNPGSGGVQVPTAQDLSEADSLENKKYPISVDENGFIKPTGENENPDISIVFLGGSTTACLYVSEEKRFPALVGKKLQEKSGKKVNSYNSGVPGNNTIHSLDILLNKVVPMKPDIVVMMHNVNDLNALLYEGTYWNDNRSRSPIEKRAHNRGIKGFVRVHFPNLYKLVTFSLKGTENDEFSDIRGTKLVIDREKIVGDYVKNLQSFIYLCRIYGIEPVLMTQASRFTPQPDDLVKKTAARLKKDFDIDYNDYYMTYFTINQAIRAIASREEVMAIDLAKEIPPVKTYLYDTVHYNDLGSELASDIITRHLLPGAMASEVVQEAPVPAQEPPAEAAPEQTPPAQPAPAQTQN